MSKVVLVKVSLEFGVLRASVAASGGVDAAAAVHVVKDVVEDEVGLIRDDADSHLSSKACHAIVDDEPVDPSGYDADNYNLEGVDGE